VTFSYARTVITFVFGYVNLLVAAEPAGMFIECWLLSYFWLQCHCQPSSGWAWFFIPLDTQ